MANAEGDDHRAVSFFAFYAAPGKSYLLKSKMLLGAFVFVAAGAGAAGEGAGELTAGTDDDDGNDVGAADACASDGEGVCCAFSISCSLLACSSRALNAG